jgi:hypothetical protein
MIYKTRLQHHRSLMIPFSIVTLKFVTYVSDYQNAYVPSPLSDRLDAMLLERLKQVANALLYGDVLDA